MTEADLSLLMRKVDESLAALRRVERTLGEMRADLHATTLDTQAAITRGHVNYGRMAMLETDLADLRTRIAHLENKA